MKCSSLRAQLLRWLLLPLIVLGVVDALHTDITVDRAVDAAFDRSLYASALAISEHVALGAGQPVVDLPPVALEMLETGEQERVYYRVSYQASGGGDTFISGYADLPAAPAPLVGTPVFFDGQYLDNDVRIVALRSQVPQDARMTVLVLVAQTLLGRTATTRSIVARSLISELGLMALAAALVWLAVTRGLRPLRRLSSEVAQRSASQLTPLQPAVPREVLPLIEATNGLMARVREAIEAQQRFVADASHQLRTPLAVLWAEADAALRHDDLASMRAAVERLREHSQATSHLVAQLLSLARTEPKAEPGGSQPALELTALAREACAALVPAALQREVDLGFEGATPLSIRGHRVLLGELIANLVSNAVQYGRAQGHVTVRVERRGRETACLAVEDDGPGIPAAERVRVFQRFYRIPGTPGHGAGLGLAIVRQIADRHSASVHLLDVPTGQGLLVEVRFPMADVPPD